MKLKILHGSSNDEREILILQGFLGKRITNVEHEDLENGTKRDCWMCSGKFLSEQGNLMASPLLNIYTCC